MSNFTKGPWLLEQRSNTWRLLVDGKTLATIQGDTPEGNANAHLMRASPELLNACRRALREIEEGETTVGLVEDLVIAIAKAEGSCE